MCLNIECQNVVRKANDEKMLTSCFLWQFLRRWFQEIDIRPWFSNTVLNILQKKMDTLEDQQKLCIVTLDEMSLKSSLKYQSNSDELVGLEDYGHRKSCFSFYVVRHSGKVEATYQLLFCS